MIVSRQALGTIAVLAAMALVVLDAGIAHVALPTIARSMHVTPALAVLIVSSYQLALVMGLLPCAQLAERLGYRRLFVGGIAVFSCASLLCSLAPSLPWLVAARFVQGLGGAAIMSLGIPLLRFALTPERFASAIGWNALVVAIGSAAGPTLGALMLSFLDWPWLFLINLPVGVLALLAGRTLPQVEPTRTSTDLLSIGLYAGVAALVVAAAELATAWPVISLGLGIAALPCVFGLMACERHKKAPLVPFDLLRKRPFSLSVIASMFVFTGQSAGLVALSFYVQLGLGRSALVAGLVMTMWPLAVAGTSRAAGPLAERFGASQVCAAGAAVLALGLGAFAFWPIESSIESLAACAAVCGAGFGLFQVTNNRSMFLAAPAERSAAAGGMQGTARLMGQTTGALIVTAMMTLEPTGTASRLAMGIGALAALCAAFVSWLGVVQRSSSLPPGLPDAGKVNELPRRSSAPLSEPFQPPSLIERPCRMTTTTWALQMNFVNCQILRPDRWLWSRPRHG
jgi:DHA2 family multidrug resistance protein-like MFS transporter